MSKGASRGRGRREYKPLEGDAFELGNIDRLEDKARLEASAKMLAALMREHPDRASMGSPNGTDAPMRVPMPASETLRSIDFEG